MNFKKIAIFIENFYYRVLIKNLLKLSKLGFGFVVTGAEAGTNYEHIYDNKAEGSFVVGKIVDRILLNLTAVQSTRQRKDDVKRSVLNECLNNAVQEKKTKVLDLASGGARYLRELKNEHNGAVIESLCVDKNKSCVAMGRRLAFVEGVANLRFIVGDIFSASRLKRFSERIDWKPNVVVFSGLFIYFNDDIVKGLLQETFNLLEPGGCVIFTSYERLNTKKLMRKTMATSTGDDWTLYYRKPIFWRKLAYSIGFHDITITEDKWLMNNVICARKPKVS